MPNHLKEEIILKSLIVTNRKHQWRNYDEQTQTINNLDKQPSEHTQRFFYELRIVVLFDFFFAPSWLYITICLNEYGQTSLPLRAHWYVSYVIETHKQVTEYASKWISSSNARIVNSNQHFFFFFFMQNSCFRLSDMFLNLWSLQKCQINWLENHMF